MRSSVLRFPALEIRQGAERTLYAFAVDGKSLPAFTTVSRVRRRGVNQLLGYQRGEVLSHIAEIRKYLETENPMIPNALVMAFDDRARFIPEPDARSDCPHSRSGTFEIVVDNSLPADQKPGLVVDGQQRMAAIRDAKINSLPVCVVAFITSDVQEQREQFILVNSTRPLPKGLIYELLPTTEGRLPSLLQRRRFPAYLMDRLNYDDDSPFNQMIRTPTNPDGIVKDNSLLRMMENSLSDGVLFRFRDPATGEGDTDTMLGILKAFWRAAAAVFQYAWGQPPRRSRLMHGAGIVSMGFVMDAISDRYRVEGTPRYDHFYADLKPLQDICRWTDGYWEFGPGIQRKWNEIQNTSKDTRLLANYLLVQYKNRVWNRDVSSTGQGNPSDCSPS